MSIGKKTVINTLQLKKDKNGDLHVPTSEFIAVLFTTSDPQDHVTEDIFSCCLPARILGRLQ